MDQTIDVKPKSEEVSKKVVAVEMIKMQKQTIILGTAVIIACFLTLILNAFSLGLSLFAVSLFSFIGVFVIFRAKKEIQRLKTKYNL
jgi:uncharacterized membrane protein